MHDTKRCFVLLLYCLSDYLRLLLEVVYVLFIL